MPCAFPALDRLAAFAADKLREHFGQYGELLEVVSAGPGGRAGIALPCSSALIAGVLPPLQVVMRDKATGRPRGFGFVSFADPKVADTVVQETHIVDGRQASALGMAEIVGCAVPRCAQPTRIQPNFMQIDAKKSVPQEQKPKARKIFVGGLSPETSEGEWRRTAALQHRGVPAAVFLTLSPICPSPPRR